MLTAISLGPKQRCCVINILPFNCKSTLFLSCFEILKLGPVNMSPLMAGQCRLCQERAAEIQQRRSLFWFPSAFFPPTSLRLVAYVSRVCVYVAQLCPTLCDPVDCSPPGSSVHGFSRQEYWSGLPFPSPGDLPNPRTEARSPALKADSLRPEPPKLTMWVLVALTLSGFLDPTANSFLWTSSALQVSWLISPPIGEPLTPRGDWISALRWGVVKNTVKFLVPFSVSFLSQGEWVQVQGRLSALVLSLLCLLFIYLLSLLCLLVVSHPLLS